MSTGVAQAATDTGLAQEWPREPDASAKEAQVGKPGRGPPDGEMVLLRGRGMPTSTFAFAIGRGMGAT